MRILCVIPTLGPGGAERVMSQLLRAFVERHEIRLLTWEKQGVQPFFPLPETVSVVHAGMLGAGGLAGRISRMVERLLIVRREVRSFAPSVVLSFLTETNLLTLAACLGSGTPVVVSERTDPNRHMVGTAKQTLRRALYPLAACCVVQTMRAKSFFTAWRNIQISVIPNPVPTPATYAQPGTPNGQGRFRVVTLGRLGPEKGHDLLIDAFARIAGLFPTWDLAIFGEGPIRPALENRVRRHGLGDRVQLPGLTQEPLAELAASHVMAFPSHYEGFPNALAEALATGLPSIGMIGVSGVEDMILDHETGLLVDPAKGPPALADALSRLMSAPDLRIRLGGKARLHMEHWRPDCVQDQWEALLTSVAKAAS